MQNKIFDMLHFISSNVENDAEFYKDLTDMTKEEVVRTYKQLKRKDGLDTSPSIAKEEQCPPVR